MKSIADIKIAISCFMIASAAVASAQITDDFRRKYETETIYFSGNGYIKNETKYRLPQLKTEFDFSKEGSLMFNESRKDKRRFMVFYLASLGSLIAAAAIDENRSNSNMPAILMGATVASLSTSIYFGVRSDKRLHKAVWLRNRDVLLKPN